MAQFRQITSVALLAGTISGLALFALQHFTVQPLIAAAEQYEARAEQARQGASSSAHDTGEWEPAGGGQRIGITALAGVLTGIAFAALLFGVAALWNTPMTPARGLLWGLAGFACFVLAPALGLPPEPPGIVSADLGARQWWWTATVASTAGGLLLLSTPGRDAPSGGRLRWLMRAAGVLAILLPHAIGAPHQVQSQVVPDDLIRKFQIASISTNAAFWLLLGGIGGWISSRLQRDPR